MQESMIKKKTITFIEINNTWQFFLKKTCDKHENIYSHPHIAEINIPKVSGSNLF